MNTAFLIKRDGLTIAGMLSEADAAIDGLMAITGLGVFTKPENELQLKNDAICRRRVELELSYADGRRFKGKFRPREVCHIDTVNGERRHRVILTTTDPVQVIN